MFFFNNVDSLKLKKQIIKKIIIKKTKSLKSPKIPSTKIHFFAKIFCKFFAIKYFAKYLQMIFGKFAFALFA